MGHGMIVRQKDVAFSQTIDERCVRISDNVPESFVLQNKDHHVSGRKRAYGKYRFRPENNASQEHKKENSRNSCADFPERDSFHLFEILQKQKFFEPVVKNDIVCRHFDSRPDIGPLDIIQPRQNLPGSPFP